MKIRYCFLALICVLLPWSQPGALTIYRLGGASLPPPDLPAGAQFVQLQWEAIESAQHGQAEQLSITPDLIEPEQLDPSVNLTPRLKERGGRIQTLVWTGWEPSSQRDAVLWDEDPETVFLGDGSWTTSGIGVRNKSLIFDFGGNFTVERIRFFPRDRFAEDRFVQRFIIGVSDGDPLKEGTREYSKGNRGDIFDFDIVHQTTENTTSFVELDLPSAPIRRLLFEAPENTQGIWEIAEFEIYGKGFTPAASYVSNVIDLGGNAALGELSWQAEVDAGAQVELGMRAGDDDDPNTYWRNTFRGDERTRLDTRGRVMTLRSYNRLEKAQQAGITPDTENWEGWSAPYDLRADSAPMQSNKPRQFVQLRADFLSTVEAGGRLGYVQFAVSQPPVATLVSAEITPTLAPSGEITQFTYLLLPQMEFGDLGFDTIEIDTPTAIEGVDAVRFSGEDVAFDVMRIDERGFEIAIPRVDQTRDGELIEVVFSSPVFKFGTLFSGRVYDSTQPLEVRQVITAGEVDELVESNTLSVGLSNLSAEVVGALKLVPAAFTPNGDGINDQVRIEYDLLNVAGSAEVTVVLYDLRGGRIGEVFRGPARSGQFQTAWDGRDQAGVLLDPGIYILRLEVETDRGTKARERIVSLAY
jgi:hypothetical protein